MKTKQQVAIFVIQIVMLCLIIISIIGLFVKGANAHRQENQDNSQTIVSQGVFSISTNVKNKDLNIFGWAQMIRNNNETTTVQIKLEGLAANTTYPVYVNTAPCEEGGGGHYKIRINETGCYRENEIRPFLKTNSTGIGEGEITVNHWARPDAQSIVVHDPVNGNKLACADIFLVQENVYAEPY